MSPARLRRHRTFSWAHPWQWIWRVALLAVVLWCGAYSIWDAHDRRVWRERGVEATAVVTDVSCGGEGSFVRVDLAGSSRTVTPCPIPGPRLGAAVDVVYDSADSSQLRLAQQFDRTSGRAALWVAIGTAVFLAMMEAYWVRERRAP